MCHCNTPIWVCRFQLRYRRYIKKHSIRMRKRKKRHAVANDKLADEEREMLSPGTSSLKAEERISIGAGDDKPDVEDDRI